MMRSFNLLPWRERRFRARRRNALIALGLGVVGALGMIVATDVFLRHVLAEAVEQNNDIRSAISDAERAKVGRGELESRKAELSAFLEGLARIRESNRTVRGWLGDLPALATDSSYFTRLRLTDEGWELRGATADLDQAARLLRRMRAIPAVGEVHVEQLQSESDRSRQFMLVGRLTQ